MHHGFWLALLVGLVVAAIFLQALRETLAA